jgi:trimethylamine:corrinoid methyltransferase-like protein
MGKLQSIKVLTDSEIDMVHETALRVLSEVGISLSEPAIASRMKEAGAWLANTDGFVRISRDMVETALKKAIQRVGPSGNFLSDKHTRTWLRKGENIYLKIFDRTAVSTVKKDLLKVAHARVEELLKDHQPDVPASLCQEIDDYVREVEPALNKS